MKLGAEPKKLMILGGLLVVALGVFLFNGGGSGDSGSPSPAPSAARPSTTASGLPSTTASGLPSTTASGLPSTTASGLPAASPRAPAPTASNTKGGRRTSAEFRPTLKPKVDRDKIDPMTIDPTLKVDVLARLQGISVTGTHRSLFDFSNAPPPKGPDAPKVAGAKKPVPSPIVPVEAVKPVEAAKVDTTPKAPPVPMKFFGYVSPRGDVQKRAFFMEGEEIHIVREGDVVKRRYKIVRIGVNSVVVEDTNFPGSSQTLPLEEQPG